MIGQTLREARQQAGMHQQDLADHLGVSLWVVNRVELENRSFDPSWLPSLPPALRIPVGKILEQQYEERLNWVRDCLQEGIFA